MEKASANDDGHSSRKPFSQTPTHFHTLTSHLFSCQLLTFAPISAIFGIPPNTKNSPEPPPLQYNLHNIFTICPNNNHTKTKV
jgi:hypothetical protein